MRVKTSTAPVVLIVGVLAFIITWLWLLPAVRLQMSDLETKKLQRAELQQRVDDLNALVSVLALEPGSIGALPISYEQLQTSLPDARQTEDLYAMIDKVVADLGLTSETTISVNQPSESDAVTGVVVASPIQIVTKTSYDGAKQLLDRLTVTLRPLSIGGIAMAPTESGAVSLTINGFAYTRSDGTAADATDTTSTTE